MFAIHKEDKNMPGYSGTRTCAGCGKVFSYTNYNCVPSLCGGCFGESKIESHSHGSNNGTDVCSGCGRTFSYSNYDCAPSLCKRCYIAREISEHKVF